MKRFKIGLVVGKFCPLHRGHEAVIRRALELSEEVILISYTKPEFPGCEPEKREHWLAARFPQTIRLVVTEARLREWFPSRNGTTSPRLPGNSDAEIDHRRFVGQLCLDLLQRRVNAVFTSENYGDGFAAELSRMALERGISGPPVVHHLVDLDRKDIPVSGQQLRRDPHAGRAFLAPEVYASFVHRIALLGAESTGKSTLAAALADTLDTRYVPEYGRERWIEKEGHLEFDDLLQIAEVQCAREDAALLEANRYLFCDTTPLTTLFYSQHLFGRTAPKLIERAHRTYEQTILCLPDFPFVQDGTREGEALRSTQHAWYLRELTARQIRPFFAAGSLSTRVQKIVAHLESAIPN